MSHYTLISLQLVIIQTFFICARFLPENMASLGNTVGEQLSPVPVVVWLYSITIIRHSVYIRRATDKDIISHADMNIAKICHAIVYYLVTCWPLFLTACVDASLLSQSESGGSSWTFGLFSLLSFNGKESGLLESKWRFLFYTCCPQI